MAPEVQLDIAKCLGFLEHACSNIGSEMRCVNDRLNTAHETWRSNRIAKEAFDEANCKHIEDREEFIKHYEEVVKLRKQSQEAKDEWVEACMDRACSDTGLAVAIAKWWEAKAMLTERELWDYRHRGLTEDESFIQEYDGDAAVEEWKRFREVNKSLFAEMDEMDKAMRRFPVFRYRGCSDDEIHRVYKLQDHIAAVRKELDPESEDQEA